MTNPSRQEVTLLLQAWSEGDPTAPEKLAQLEFYHRVRERPYREAHNTQAEKNQHHIEDSTGMRELVLRIGPNRRDRHQRGVERRKPRPPLDQVKAHRPHRQQDDDEPKDNRCTMKGSQRRSATENSNNLQSRNRPD